MQRYAIVAGAVLLSLVLGAAVFSDPIAWAVGDGQAGIAAVGQRPFQVTFEKVSGDVPESCAPVKLAPGEAVRARGGCAG